jgi:hypothetical protein
MRILPVSDPRHTTVTVSDGHDDSVLICDGIEPLQAIALADALAPPAEFLAVCAIEEEDLSAAGRR